MVEARTGCDALAGNRDLIRRPPAGDLDFPRMPEGDCAVELFLAVTELPARPLPTTRATAKSDGPATFSGKLSIDLSGSLHGAAAGSIVAISLFRAAHT